MIEISIIVAFAENRAIGVDNHLIYRLPNDLKRFKNLTTGNTIIMGRRTFESLPKGALPNRRNIVLSKSGQPSDFPGADLFRSFEEAMIDCINKSKGHTTPDKVYVIGGESVYKQAMIHAKELCITYIHDTPERADAFFPIFSISNWKETFFEHHEADEKHAVAYDFFTLKRQSWCMPD